MGMSGLGLASSFPRAKGSHSWELGLSTDHEQFQSLIKILSSHGFSSHVHGPTLLLLLHDLVGGSHPPHTHIPSPCSGLILASFTPPHSSKADMPLSPLESSYGLRLLTTHIGPRAPLAPPSLLPSLDALRGPKLKSCVGFSGGRRGILVLPARASLIESPVLWAGRICGFYALLKAGLAGSPPNPLISDSAFGDLGFSEWLERLQGRSEDKEAIARRKLVSKWHPTTKGTLKRSYRVPSRAVGLKLLKGIASLLSDDDHFRDATSHKGCQIRRESAHGESVCCNNVRALFDELPTPRLTVEITPFPAGPLTEKDYEKAEKLERVLRSGASI